MREIVNGISMHVRVLGPADGLPLLLIHGFPLTGEIWSPVASLLEDQFRLIIPDLRGFGQSELAEQHEPGVVPAMSIAQYADDLFVMLEEIGEQRPMVVVGLSMGGYIAMEFHRRFTSAVRALALVDTRAEPDTPERAQERLAAAERVRNEGSGVIANSIVDKLFAPGAPSVLREQWHRIMMQLRPEAIAAALLAMAARGGYMDMLHTILCPTLIIVGEQDIITPPADAQTLKRGILISEVEVIPEAGHLTPIEQPERLSATITRFLNQHVISHAPIASSASARV